MSTYPITITFDEQTGEYEISYRDFSDLYSVVLHEQDSELEARDRLLVHIADIIASGAVVPAPSPALKGDVLLALPLLACLKIKLHNAIIDSGIRKIDLARKLSLNGAQLERLLDIDHASKVETLEQALYLLGYEIFVSVNERGE